MKVCASALAVVSASALGVVAVAAAAGDQLDDSGFLRFRQEEAHVNKHTELSMAAATSDVFTKALCASSEAAAYFGYKCKPASPSSTTTDAPAATTTTDKPANTTANPGTSTTPAPTAPVSTSATYDLHALAIGDWGVDLGLGSCCNKYRQTGTGNAEYYKDQQAQPNVAHLLALSAANLKPKVILGHGDSFYWNGLGSKDVNYRFTNTFEAMYNQPSLQNVKWVNVMGNHDYGGSMFICGEYDNQFYECTSKADLLKQLEDKFTRQAKYVSPNGDRWKMPERYYVERISDPTSGVSVDIFNVDTNAATVHGGEQICCQCYGYLMKYGGKDVKCNNVHRGHSHCAGGDNDLFDACLAKIKGWQDDSLRQLAEDAKKSTATWKVVNSHYSPHFHMEPNMMQQWFDVLDATGVHVFINGHAHAESHEWATFNTHFVTNGAGGGIQSESIGSPPPYVTDVSTVWIGANAPYGIFEMSFGKTQMRLRFMTFDDKWVFNANKGDTVKGGAKVGHCWMVPIDGSKGAAC